MVVRMKAFLFGWFSRWGIILGLPLPVVWNGVDSGTATVG